MIRSASSPPCWEPSQSILLGITRRVAAVQAVVLYLQGLQTRQPQEDINVLGGCPGEGHMMDTNKTSANKQIHLNT